MVVSENILITSENRILSDSDICAYQICMFSRKYEFDKFKQANSPANLIPNCWTLLGSTILL